MRWAVLAVASMMVLAGCIAGNLDAGGAVDQLNTARDVAEDHVTNPELIEVWGIEPLHRLAEDDENGEREFELILHADSEPGDGNAPLWTYHFRGQEGHVIVVVGAQIGVLAEYYEADPMLSGGWEADEDQDEATDEHEEHDGHEMSIEEHYPEVIDDWRIDAPQAAALLNANATWPSMTEDTSVAWHLHMYNGTPYWEVVSMPADFSDGNATMGHAVIDAAEGEIIQLHATEGFDDFGFGFDGEAPESPERHDLEGGCDQDSAGGLMASTGSYYATIELEEDGGWLELDARWNGAGPVNFELIYEDEDEVLWSDTGGGIGVSSGNYVSTLSGIEEGEYTLRATPGMVTASQVELHLAGGWGAAPCEAISVDWQPADLDTILGPYAPLVR